MLHASWAITSILLYSLHRCSEHLDHELVVFGESWSEPSTYSLACNSCSLVQLPMNLHAGRVRAATLARYHTSIYLPLGNVFAYIDSYLLNTKTTGLDWRSEYIRIQIHTMERKTSRRTFTHWVEIRWKKTNSKHIRERTFKRLLETRRPFPSYGKVRPEWHVRWLRH